MRAIFVVLCIHLNIINILAGECDHGYDKYYSSNGDVYIVGLFNAYKDDNCSVPNSIILQQMYNIAVTVKMLNDIDYIPGITIGMSLYDTCTTKEVPQESLVSAMMNTNCSLPFNIGIFSSQHVYNIISGYSETLDVPIYALNYAPNLDVLMKISVALLMELKYISIDLAVFPNADLIQQFNSLTVAENICVKSSYTFAQYNGSCPGNDLVIIIAVTSAELSPLLKLEMDCMSVFVIVILDNNIDLSSLTEHLLLHEAYIIISSNIWPEFAIAVEDDFQTIVTNIEENLHFSNVTMDFIRTASVIITVMDELKEKLKNECGCEEGGAFSVCTNLTRFKKSDERVIRNESTFSVPHILGIEKKSILQYLILKSHFNVVDNYGEIRIVENDVQIKFANPVLPKEVAECDTNSKSCRNCSNFAGLNEEAARFFDSIYVEFKTSGWVFSVLTVCIIGVISCACVLGFIVTRVCKQDILEGNPSSTLLLIVATVLAYMSVFPFCLRDEGSRVSCACKLFGASISYGALFSIILSRVIMILTCDYNGSFMSHINGYLQSFLGFFMFAVQFAFVLEFWVFGQTLPGRVDYCAMFKENYFLMYLLYDALLLVLLGTIVPFVTWSRRNYREGLCFTVLSVCLVVIWVVWSFGYFVASQQSKDFFAAFGLVATATSVVVCVLIPRTYFIVTGMVRDRITSAIPNASNLVDMNYRSTQALYDSVRINAVKSGELNVAYYQDAVASQEDVYPRKEVEDITIHTEEDAYESCSIANVPQKITKF